MVIENAEIIRAASVLGSGIAMGFGAIGAGLGEGYAAHMACGSISRQPAKAGEIVKMMLIGQAVAESASIFALVVSILLLFVDFSGGSLNSVAGLVGAGIAMGFGALGGGIGCGFPAGSACNGIARYPRCQNKIMTLMLITQGVSQTPSIFALVVAFLLLFKEAPVVDIVTMGALLGAGMSIGFGSIGPGIGSGQAGGHACDAISKWPKTYGEVFKVTILGQAVSQSPSIFALLISLILLFMVEGGSSIAKASAMVGAGICIGMGGFGSGVGGGYAAGMGASGVAYNVKASVAIVRTMLLGIAVAQSVAIFSLVVAFMLVFLS